MKVKVTLSIAVLAAVLALNIFASAQSGDAVLYQGKVYCLGITDCRAFAFWGATAPGYVVLYESDGRTVDDYLWVDFNGFLWFESRNASGGFAITPPAQLPFLGAIVENGQWQEVNQFFPGGRTRSLSMASSN
jgi:hypothetical protein